MKCLLKHVIEGKVEERIEVMERRGRGWRQILDYFEETRGYSKLKEEALGRPWCGICLERGYGTLERQTKL
jgi:hypothetical protein